MDLYITTASEQMSHFCESHKYHVTILYMYGMACSESMACSWELWQRKEELWLL